MVITLTSLFTAITQNTCKLSSVRENARNPFSMWCKNISAPKDDVEKHMPYFYLPQFNYKP